MGITIWNIKYGGRADEGTRRKKKGARKRKRRKTMKFVSFKELKGICGAEPRTAEEVGMANGARLIQERLLKDLTPKAPF